MATASTYTQVSTATAGDIVLGTQASNTRNFALNLIARLSLELFDENVVGGTTYVDTSGSAVVMNLGLGRVFLQKIVGNTDWAAPINFTSNAPEFLWAILIDATGGYTLTAPSWLTITDGVWTDVDTSANGLTVLRCFYDGATWRSQFVYGTGPIITSTIDKFTVNVDGQGKQLSDVVYEQSKHTKSTATIASGNTYIDPNKDFYAINVNADAVVNKTTASTVPSTDTHDLVLAFTGSGGGYTMSWASSFIDGPKIPVVDGSTTFVKVRWTAGITNGKVIDIGGVISGVHQHIYPGATFTLPLEHAAHHRIEMQTGSALTLTLSGSVKKHQVMSTLLDVVTNGATLAWAPAADVSLASSVSLSTSTGVIDNLEIFTRFEGGKDVYRVHQWDAITTLPQLPSANLIHVWRFDEGTGTTANDEVSGGVDLMLQLDATYGTAQFLSTGDKGVDLPNTPWPPAADAGQFLYPAAQSLLVPVTGDFTVYICVPDLKTTRTNVEQTIIGIGKSGSNTPHFEIWLNAQSPQDFGFALKGDEGTPVQRSLYIDNTGLVTRNAVYKVMRSGDDWTVALLGTGATSVTSNFTSPVFTGLDSTIIGRQFINSEASGSSDNWWQGTMFGIVVYDAAKTLAQDDTDAVAWFKDNRGVSGLV